MNGPSYLPNPHDHPIWSEISDELNEAMETFAPMHSPHEGWAVIQEEVDELWAEVKANVGRRDAARHEAIQVAAMAIRYVLEVCR